DSRILPAGFGGKGTWDVRGKVGGGFGTVGCRVREVDDRGIVLGFWAGKFVSSVRSRGEFGVIAYLVHVVL
nr:hypothetical protein [Tanacetum cinerariifolium]